MASKLEREPLLSRRRALKILVSAKRVTDPDMKIKVKADGSGIELGSISFKLNPFDEIAIEEALRIKEAMGGEVVVVTIGKGEAQVDLKSGLAMGADRGILVLVEEDVDSDNVARILEKIVIREQPDIVLMGKQAVDVDDGQVPQLLAEYLKWGQACFASKIEIQNGTAKVHREVDGGHEVVEIDLPAIISTDLRLNEPRLPLVPDILRADQMEVEKITPLDLGVNIEPKILVKKLSNPPQRKGGRIVKELGELVVAFKKLGFID